VKQIPLNHEQYALVDDEDFDIVKDYAWNTQPIRYSSVVVGYGYVRTTVNKKTINMHHLIFGKAPKGFVVDHKNRNKLDNRKENFRYATYSQNTANSNRHPSMWPEGTYKGVRKTTTNWFYASITFNRKLHNLGKFRTANEAAIAYNEKALEFFGEFATLNEIK
jgi:hypothetical protein